MPEGSEKIDIGTLRIYLLEAELEILELNREIAERARLSIPILGLEAKLDEQISARDTLRKRLNGMREKIDG
jgi:hypothetical protein